MKIRYAKVTLEKDERFSTPLTIVAWEVPVLIEAHGGGVTENGSTLVERDVRPDPQSEFQRLANRYKHSGNSEVPYVAQVFGVGAAGVRAIAKMIDDNIVDGKPDVGSPGSPETDEPDVTEVSDFDFVSGSAQGDAPEELQA